ncbi:peptidylprolyl isomerase [Verrucomicrobiota bacterium]
MWAKCYPAGLNKEEKMASAAARHILVKTEAECLTLKQQIADGADFTELAKEHSLCPSGAQGGALGTFSPGQMVPEFDQVVFSAPIGEVQGPVKTHFGYHLVEVTMRVD